MALADPYGHLIGKSIGAGWTIESRIPRAPGSTGGNFSICFRVRNAAGESAFCKVLDYHTAVTSPDPVAALQQMTADFQHEVANLDVVRDGSMRRVVLALEAATESESSVPMSLLSFIIFEPADGDIRVVLPATFTGLELPMRFALLHHAVLGIRELHQASIAHQDVKPSNLLVMTSDGGASEGKVADLGRASVLSRPSRFDAMRFPGDRSYAPPEILYDAIPTGFDLRRKGTDLYQLGSLTAFVLGGSSMQALVYDELDPSLRWDAWSGPYSDVEPALRDATDRAIARVLAVVPDWARPHLKPLLAGLCDPNPQTRNAMNARFLNVSNYELGRVITLLDRLRSMAILRLVTAA